MYHVYCEAQDVETLTPDYTDARRVFNRYVREWPDAVVDFDQITDFNSLDDYGLRQRVMQCDPS